MIALNQKVALAAMFAFCAVGTAHSQEVQGQKDKAGGASAINSINVSQAQLNDAGKQGNDWLHTNGDYAQTRFYPGRADQHRQRQEPAPGIQLPDRGAGVDGDRAHRGGRRHVS